MTATGPRSSVAERPIRNREVGGSTPPAGSIYKLRRAAVACGWLLLYALRLVCVAVFATVGVLLGVGAFVLAVLAIGCGVGVWAAWPFGETHGATAVAYTPDVEIALKGDTARVAEDFRRALRDNVRGIRDAVGDAR